MALLTVAEVRARLKLEPSDPPDETVEAVIAAAQENIESQVGYLQPRSVTERCLRTSSGALLLSRWPVISLTSVVTSAGETVDVSVSRLDSTGSVSWSAGVPVYAEAYDVTYQSGRATVGDDLVLALYEQVRHLLRTYKLGRRSVNQPDEEKMPGYAMPNLVMGLIKPYRVPGIA